MLEKLKRLCYSVSKLAASGVIRGAAVYCQGKAICPKL